VTFIPAQPVLLETAEWEEFKAVAITQKALALSFLEYPTYYDIRAIEAAQYRIVLTKGTPEALDFEENYKASANARYELRVVLVTTDGVPTISTIGEDAPSGAAMVAGRDGAGKTRALMLDANGRLTTIALPGALSTYTTTEAKIENPTPAPVKPTEGGPWSYVGQVAIQGMFYWFWGSP